MAAKTEPFSVLKDAQAAASSPDADVWLSASAGTGKTYVLAARVLRLLLRPGVRPDSILCLTFTRAGAAEMAERVHRRLAWWARLDDNALRRELTALGEDNDDTAIRKARTLFAAVLDARGGGLRVMTIHAFCQTLLGAFPLEAGLAPGFRAVEGREQAALASAVLGALAENAEREGDARLIAALRALSRRLGEAGTQSFLLRAARSLDALESLTDGIEAKVRRALEVPADFTPADIVEACDEDNFDHETLFELGQVLANWGKTGEKRANEISEWFHGDAKTRAAELGRLHLVWNKADGDPRTGKGQVPTDPAYEPLAARMRAWCGDLLGLQRCAALAEDIAHGLHAARRYARAYADAKKAAGLVDFDDLIGKAVALLTEPGMGAWIAYKLDQATDHILVDEAQDTNLRQWEIVEAIKEEFWAEEPDVARLRTVFTVGDYKQAIYGFQGTNPEAYRAAGERMERAAGLAQRTLTRLSLDRSFRSTPPVLAVVDALLGELGEEAFGGEALDPHDSARGGPGSVTLLPPVRTPEGEDDDGEEGWVPTATRTLASDIARQVCRWLANGHMLEGKGRPLTPGDVMILVRKRGDLAALLVARLQKEGVPVAGVDRLRLASPLAVKDCLAAMRFAVQPDDDLTLASLLVSPICGWTQEQLYDVAHVKRSGSLWGEVRRQDRAGVLGGLLRMADFVSPYVFLETMLSGEIGARKNLLRRLGNEASDPIDELLNAALQFEREGVATLQGFLDWFDRGEGEIVRDAGGQGDAVRVMTVHAAKGLQAPLVILADATADPDAGNDRDFDWVLDETIVPLFRPRAAERQLVASLEAMAMHMSEQDRREHWRLLYVAMTRAEEQLVIAGSLTQRQKFVPEESWHAAIERAMVGMGATQVDLPHWGSARIHAVAGREIVAAAKAKASDVPVVRPDWLDRPAPPEARPPRPLSPSSLGPDTVTDPPPSKVMQDAAERGRMMHALFERLPQMPTASRPVAADRWLERSAGLADSGARSEIIDAVLAVLDHNDYSHLFVPDGLAEVPVAGVVDGMVISGTVDRLLVGTNTVDIVDFKTGRRVPSGADAVPDAYKRQMAAYAAVLRGVFPGHSVRAALLYTAGPKLITLNDVDLEPHKPGFVAVQQELLSSAG
ncbi:MAG: double-strand break repair helicase AddA [Sphingomonadales bacterium]